MAVVSQCSSRDCINTFLKKDVFDKQSHCMKCLREMKRESDLTKSSQQNQTEPANTEADKEETTTQQSEPSKRANNSHFKSPDFVRLAHDYWDES